MRLLGSGDVALPFMLAVPSGNWDCPAEAIPDGYADHAELARHDLIEKAAEFDEELMAKFIEDKPVEAEEILRALRIGTIHNKCQPVLCGSALRHMGIRPLLDAVVHLLPSPLDVPPVEGHACLKSQEKIIRRNDPDEPFSALVFKITSDQHGDLSFIRVYSGTLLPGTRVLNSTQNIKENITRLWEMHAKQRNRRDDAKAGDIVAVVGLKGSLTGDTQCDTRRPIVLERLEFPEPVITMSIEPRTNAEKQRMVEALNTLRREDPTFSYNYNPETGQTTISGMGELHLEVIKHRLLREFRLNVRVHKPRVSYRETIQKGVKVTGHCHRNVAGQQLFAEVTVRMEPTRAGPKPVVVTADCGDTLPAEFLDVVLEELSEQGLGGGTLGFPLMHVKITVLGGAFQEADSNAMAFRMAAGDAFHKALRDAGIVLLEPIMRLEVTLPEENLGELVSDLQQRRAVITRTHNRGKNTVIEAQAPLANLFGYANAMRGLSQGRATCTMEPSSYGPAPPEVLEGFL